MDIVWDSGVCGRCDDRADVFENGSCRRRRIFCDFNGENVHKRKGQKETENIFVYHVRRRCRDNNRGYRACCSKTEYFRAVSA